MYRASVISKPQYIAGYAVLLVATFSSIRKIVIQVNKHDIQMSN